MVDDSYITFKWLSVSYDTCESYLDSILHIVLNRIFSLYLFWTWISIWIWYIM